MSAIEAAGGKALAVQADVSKTAEIRDLFDRTQETYSQVDILVNNAGVILYKPVAEVTEAEFDNLFAINVKGTFFAGQEAAKRMAEGGRIVNFSSSTTPIMMPAYGAYVATKGAVEQLTRSLAKELASTKLQSMSFLRAQRIQNSSLLAKPLNKYKDLLKWLLWEDLEKLKILPM